MFKNFYAVTTMAEVFKVSTEEDGLKPSVRKVAELAEKCGIKIGEKLSGGNMVSVGKQILIYPNEGIETQIEMINVMRWGGGTSTIVALFESEENAMNAAKQSNLKMADDRWSLETKIVLGKIGNDHPVFYIPFMKELRLEV